MQKDRLVLPLLVILVLNMIVSLLFIASALTAYVMSGRVTENEYDMVINRHVLVRFCPCSAIDLLLKVFLIFIMSQAVLRLYEFHCPRQLYWHYQVSDNSTMDSTHGSFLLLRKGSDTQSYNSLATPTTTKEHSTR
jgi:hypothetical protein